jgi:hypothetical protein
VPHGIATRTAHRHVVRLDWTSNRPMWRKISTILMASFTLLSLYWPYCAIAGLPSPHDSIEQSFALIMFAPTAVFFCAASFFMWKTMLKRKINHAINATSEVAAVPHPMMTDVVSKTMRGDTCIIRWPRRRIAWESPGSPKKTKALSFFLALDPTVLYQIAALPDEIAATLTPDTLLTDPRTGRQVPLKDMSARSLDRALDALEGKTPPAKPKPPSGDVTLTGKTREEFAAAALRIMDRMTDQIPDIRSRKGSLTGESKQRVLAAIESLRRIVLKWPAWATPVTKKKPTP